MRTKKVEREGLLYIRCSKFTEKRFKKFVIDVDSRNYEEALTCLLDFYEGKRSRIAIEPAGKP